ncbi:MAG: 50S ribosomal protein L18 [Candidatus Yanofskybacteria bacterium]|nr:50S ribosomal protein L18 [Candidatus Yanofskybacteria bacterium]
MNTQLKEEKRARRHARIRAKIAGTPERPRLVVFRSNQHLYAQLIDDTKGHTLASVSDRDMSKKGAKPMERAAEIGTLLGEKAKSKNIQAAVFDRRGYTYHGRVKAVADGARKAGLNF